MLTKNVNGVRVEMTPEEETAFEASRRPMPKKAPRMPEHEILREAMREKGLLTDADLDAANTRLLDAKRQGPGG